MSFRITIGAILVIWLTMSCAFFSTTSGQTRSTPATSRIEALLQERCDVLSKRVEYFSAQFHNAKITRIPVLEAKDELIAAKIELAKTREERLEILKSRVANLKDVEESYVALRTRAMADESEVLQATSKRLLAEIELERALSDE